MKKNFFIDGLKMTFIPTFIFAAYAIAAQLIAWEISNLPVVIATIPLGVIWYRWLNHRAKKFVEDLLNENEEG